MKQEYFELQGEKYNSGDTFYILWYGKYSTTPNICKAKFLWYDTETELYHIKIDGRDSVISQNIFGKWFRSKAYMDEQKYIAQKRKEPRQATMSDEIRIDSLLIAWVWYVIIMAIGVLFYDRIAIWIIASIIFFRYRRNKLREAGFK